MKSKNNKHTCNVNTNNKGKEITTYHVKGLLHRVNKPALIIKNKYGEVIKEAYYIRGKLHNSNGYAFYVVKRNPLKSIKVFEWYQQGKKHRINAPAVIIQDEKTSETRGEYWLKGKHYSEESYKDEMFKRKLMLIDK